MSRKFRETAMLGAAWAISIFCHPAIAQDCPNPTETYFTPGALLSNPDYAGQLFWLPNGKDGSSFRPIRDCVTISVAGRPKLFFAFGNKLEKRQPQEGQTFVAVQVLRLLNSRQTTPIRVSRFGEWSRDANTLAAIDDEPVAGMTIASFLSIHAKMTPDDPGDDQLRFGGNYWHGVPARGLFSSISVGSRFYSDEIKAFAENDRVVLSNRLYNIHIPPNQKTIFYVSTSDTRTIILRAFSPSRSEFEQTVRVELAR